MLSPEALINFKRIWKEEFGEEISDELATEKAVNLLMLFDKVYRPVKKSFALYGEGLSVRPLQKTD